MDEVIAAPFLDVELSAAQRLAILEIAADGSPTPVGQIDGLAVGAVRLAGS